MEEKWLPVKGYEGLYEVSDWGNVRSLNYRHSGKPHLLKPSKDRGGYLFVGLYKDEEVKSKSIHRLVAEVFIPNPNHLSQINHKDEDKTNNRVDNLEYCTAKYNINYGTRNQKSSDSQSIAIDQLDKDGNFIRHWKSLIEVQRQLGINVGGISSCLRGKQNTAGGYKWRYA